MKTRTEKHEPKENKVRYSNGYRVIEPTHSIWFMASLPFVIGLGIGILIGVYFI